MNKPRVVVCAATLLVVKNYDSVVLLGAHHWDQSMHNQLFSQEEIFETPDQETQGFIDQYGVFMTREEAYVVARDAGQIKYRCGGDDGVLFSENLY